MQNGMNPTDQKTEFGDLLTQYLRSRSQAKTPADHLDHDTLAAFTEGRLSERQSLPVLRHLVDCSFCLHVTAELVRLEAEFTDETVMQANPAPTTEPARVSDVLSGLFTRMFGSADSAVFAHDTDTPDPDAERTEDEDPKSE